MSLPSVPIMGASQVAVNGTDAQLIWELVAQISAPAAGLRAKMKDRMFRAAYREAQNLWNSDLNAEDRIKVKARAMVEDSLLTVFEILKASDTIPQLKLEAFEKLMKVGDLGPKKEKDGGTRPFSIVMQFSNPEKRVVIDGHALENLPAEPA